MIPRPKRSNLGSNKQTNKHIFVSKLGQLLIPRNVSLAVLTRTCIPPGGPSSNPESQYQAPSSESTCSSSSLVYRFPTSLRESPADLVHSCCPQRTCEKRQTGLHLQKGGGWQQLINVHKPSQGSCRGRRLQRNVITLRL